MPDSVLFQSPRVPFQDIPIPKCPDLPRFKIFPLDSLRFSPTRDEMKESDSRSSLFRLPEGRAILSARPHGRHRREVRNRRHRERTARTGGNALIRQAISCDICGSEKKQTNHWFVAHDQGGELRVSGWNSRNRLRPGSKHLCGQTCLHKLVDEFMARCLQMRVQNSAGEEGNIEDQLPRTNASLTSDAAYSEFSSSARL